MLVIMALVTTFMTTPILGWIYPPEEQERMIAEEGGEEASFRVLVHVPTLDNGFELAHIAMSLAPSQDHPVEVVLLRTLQRPESAFRSGLRQERRGERAAAALRPLVAFVEGGGASAVPLVVPTRSLGETIVRVVDERQPGLVLMSMRSPVFGGRLLGGALGHVLRDAPADVAVLVDPAGRGTALSKGSRIIVPYGHGFHEHAGLDLALRLARSSGARVHLLGGGDDDGAHALAEEAAESYARSGVWTTADAVSGDVVGAILTAGREADLVVLAVSETWADDDRATLGRLRDVVAGASTTPLLIVRRHGRPPRRRAEWMEDGALAEGSLTTVR
jgi:hypothetical protein